MSTPITYSYCAGVSLNVKKQEEELKGIQSRKEEMKLSMFTDGMTVYVEKFQ